MADEKDYAAMYRQMAAVVDVRSLAHCKTCWEPLYCIYDQALRDECYECGGTANVDSSVALREIRAERRA